MASGTVGWHFFDVEAGRIPEESGPSTLPEDGRGRIVVLAATPFANSDGWGAKAAALISKGWADAGLRVVLMDLGLEEPSLHEVLGLPNGEGVSDAFLFGASIQHIAQPAMDQAFFFAPAGSRPGDPAEVLGHPRWNDLAGGFSEADATLLLYLPTGIPGADKILSRATDIVFFSAEGESAESHLGPASIKVVVNAGPVGSPPEEDLEATAVEASEGQPQQQEAILETDTEEVAEAPDLDAEGPEEPREKEEEGSEFSFDLSDEFSGGFELAEGFGEMKEESGTEPWGQEPTLEMGGEEESTLDIGAEEELAPTLDGLEEAEAATEEPGLAEDVEEEIQPVVGMSDEIDLEAEPEISDASVFGDDLTMGSSLVEEEDDEEAPTGRPDFEPDFVDLGPEEESPEAETGFGGDLVQGADFGGLATEAAPALEEEVPEGVSGEGEAEEEPGELPDEGKTREKPKRRKPPRKKLPVGMLVGIVVALVVIGSAVATALEIVNVPGFSFVRDYFAEIPDPPLTLAGPRPNEEVLRFSLLLFSYEEEELPDAEEMLEALRARLPELLFVLAPEEEDGDLTYALMAGPAYDRIGAEDLRGPLSEVLTREDPNSWTVRETPRGFYLDERGTLEDAENYVRSLPQEGIHPYILHVTYPDSSEAFEIMAGAYEGVLDARPLQLILRDEGLRDLPLIERRGRLPE